MATKAELQSLLERVEAATGPDREIDGAAAVALRDLKPTIQPWAKENFPSWSSDGTGRVFGIHDDGTLGPNWLSDHYTASIDAALALVERMLPGFQEIRLQLSLPLGDYCNATIYRDTFTQQYDETFVAPNKSAPLAILAALLRALISQADADLPSR